MLVSSLCLVCRQGLYLFDFFRIFPSDEDFYVLSLGGRTWREDMAGGQGGLGVGGVNNIFDVRHDTSISGCHIALSPNSVGFGTE